MIILPHSQRQRYPCNAFTLIEVLVAVTVVAILTAILVPMVTIMVSSSIQAKCARNLHSIGAAILLYSVDHGELLPGPTYYSQSAGSRDQYFLSSHLRSYMGYDDSHQVASPVDAFQCPSVPLGEMSYLATHSIRTRTSTIGLSPWGLVSGSSGRNSNPMRISDIDDYYAAAGQWIVRDAYGVSPQYYPWTASPRGPVKHTKTNVLFLDGHVETE